MKTKEIILSKQTMSSLEIAELTGKQHAHVMRDIRNMIESLKKSNESTSGLVEEDYHRGDRTQYKYLSESTQKKLLNFAFSVGGSQYVITEDSYQDAKGEQRTLYSLNKKASILLASGYDVVLRAKIIDRWEALETGKAEPIVKQSLTPSELILQLAQINVENERKMKELECKQEKMQVELEEIKQRTTTDLHCSTIVAYVSRNKIKLDVSRYGAMGKKASSLCKKRGIEPTCIHDVRWGVVKVYPDDILDSVFDMGGLSHEN